MSATSFYENNKNQNGHVIKWLLTELGRVRREKVTDLVALVPYVLTSSQIFSVRPSHSSLLQAWHGPGAIRDIRPETAAKETVCGVV